MKKMEKLKINYPLKTKIIIITNQPNESLEDPNELIIGEVIGYEEITKAKRPVIVYKDLKTMEECITLSTILYYSETLEKNLLKLNWAERFNIVNFGLSILDDNYIKEQEKKLLKDI